MRGDNIKKNPVYFHSAATFYFRGLTLIELILTLSIFSILIGAGIPMVSNMVSGNQLETEASAIRNILSLARSEAITRRTYITLCARKNNADQCLPGATNEDWRNNGWILFRDNAVSGPANIENTAAQIIRIQEPMGNSLQLTVTGNPAYIRFTPKGNSSSSTTFRFCIPGASNERYAEEVILSSGRVRTVDGEETACL